MNFNDGFYRLEVDRPETRLTLSGQVQLVIDLIGRNQMSLELICEADSVVSLLIMNRCASDSEVKEVIRIKKGSQVSLNFGEFSKGAHSKETSILCEEPHSQCDIHGAVFTEGIFKWKVHANHLSMHSYCNVNINGIAAKNSSVDLEVIGQISKGNGQSETHQMTRMMTLGDPKKVKVFPKLLITENDVAASHAASVGQPDEDAIYYLRSRGLSYNEAKKLLMLGYLLPIIDGIEDLQIKEELEHEIKDRVNHHG